MDVKQYQNAPDTARATLSFRRVILLILALSGFAHTGLVIADDPPERFGLLPPLPYGIKTGLTVTWQASELHDVDDELLASLDILIHRQLGQGELTLYIEGSATPEASGVSSLFPESNGDAGTAMDGDGQGRFQISEFFYRHNVGRGRLSVGLINPGSTLDLSDVANDETTQFLATSLVNNPTIGFPDYTLGIYYHQDAEEAGMQGMTLLAGGSHGLADNPSASYASLFDLDDDGKGAFLAAEAYGMAGDIVWRVGGWVNSADHERLDDATQEEANFGLHANLDGALGSTRWSFRLGWANPEVSAAEWFASAAMEHTLPWGASGGLGTAYTWVSEEFPDQVEDQWVTELYLRQKLASGLYITPALQYHENANLGDASGPSGWIASLRFTLAV